MDYDEQVIDRQAEICKALGHPRRLQTIYLLKDGAIAAGALATALGISPANLSQHLNILRQAGLIQCRREGNHVLYRLTTPAILEACATVMTVLDERMREEHEFLERTVR